METRTVEDLMVPLDEYPSVSETATLAEAVEALAEAQRSLPEGRSPYRAVLVVDRQGGVIGKIGQLAFMRAFEPRHELPDSDVSRLEAAGVSADLIDSMLDHRSFFTDALSDLCARRRMLPVTEAMHPTTESIDVGTPLGEAVHKIVAWQQLSILVTRHGKPIGLLRLSDLFDEVARHISGKE